MRHFCKKQTNENKNIVNLCEIFDYAVKYAGFLKKQKNLIEKKNLTRIGYKSLRGNVDLFNTNSTGSAG